MSYFDQYGYVDAFHEHPTSHKRTRWVRIKVDEVETKITGPYNNSNCYTTVQRFKDATSDQEGTEVLVDASGGGAGNGHDYAEQARMVREAEADDLPDQQFHYHGLYFDFDADYHRLGIPEAEALGRALRDVRELHSWFVNELDLNPAHVQVWFSGAKGFHLMVRPEVFNIRPHRHLTYICQRVALHFQEFLGLTTLDTSVYTARRMWRIPNTTHPATGRFKVELDASELAAENAIEKILELSRGPRELYPGAPKLIDSNVYQLLEYEGIVPLRAAVEFFREFYELYETYRDMQRVKPRRSIIQPSAGADADAYPACVTDLVTNGPKPGGPNRNRVLLPLAAFFHDTGLSKEATHLQIENWTRAWYSDPGMLRQRLQNGKTVVEAAFRGKLRFSCRTIRTCGGPGGKNRVLCGGEATCPWVGSPQDQDPEHTPTVHLSEATKGCYIGARVRTPIHIAAIAGQPFDLPTKGEILCSPDEDNEMCQGCPGADSGKTEWEFSASDEMMLQLINVNEAMKKGTIKRKAKIPQKCYRNTIEILERTTLEEVQMIPMVDYSQVYMEDDADKEGEIATMSGKHVVRRGFYMGHGIVANTKYMIEASVFPYPKDQRICFVFDKFETAQNDIDQFKMTPELYRKLLVFQKGKEETVEQKFLDIHRDLAANIHQIGGRFDLSTAVDLCYHSVIGFKFLGKFVRKGWFELLVVGDSACGKSSMVERMMQHYGLGEMIAGEESKRTGLVYASIQMNGQWILRWGKIPVNDRRLLIIDEFGGIPGEEVAKMTQLRSEGRARGGGVNTDYETWARTRLILLSNPRFHRGKMGEFRYGIQAVDRMFDENQDVRRVDFAVVAEKEEVETRHMNRRWDNIDIPHRYTADLCRNMVLWAWSRDPRHVKWAPGAEDQVLNWAERLGGTYESDIALAEKADLRIKLARISVAVAARLFSTDSHAKNVIVELEHVDFAAMQVDNAYRKPTMGYFDYALGYKEDNHFTQERLERIKKAFDHFDDPEEIVKALFDLDVVTRPALADGVSLESDDVTKVWRFLVKERLMKRCARGYTKSPAFQNWLRLQMGGAKHYTGREYMTGGVEFMKQKEPEPTVGKVTWRDKQPGGAKPYVYSSKKPIGADDDPNYPQYWNSAADAGLTPEEEAMASRDDDGPAPIPADTLFDLDGEEPPY